MTGFEFKEQSEPYIMERAEQARLMAERVATGDVSTESEFAMAQIAIIARHLKIGFFDPYFENRTLDELLFEVYLIGAMNDPEGVTRRRAAEKIQESPEQFFSKEELEDSVPI